MNHLVVFTSFFFSFLLSTEALAENQRVPHGSGSGTIERDYNRFVSNTYIAFAASAGKQAGKKAAFGIGAAAIPPLAVALVAGGTLLTAYEAYQLWSTPSD